MYKTACTLSREALLALSLIEKAMQRRTRDESTHGCRWQGAVGAMRHRWVYGGKGPCGSAAVRRASVCAVHETVRSDPAPNCSEAGADALSCQGQSHDEAPWRQGNTCTSPWLGGPLPLWWAALCLGNILLHMVTSPGAESPTSLGPARVQSFSCTGLVEMESSMSCKHWSPASHIMLGYTAPMSTSLEAKYSLLYGGEGRGGEGKGRRNEGRIGKKKRKRKRRRKKKNVWNLFFFLSLRSISHIQTREAVVMSRRQWAPWQLSWHHQSTWAGKTRAERTQE